MKAYVIEQYGKDLQLEDVREPICGDNDVVIKNLKAGICGTDLKIKSGKLDGIITLPHIPGHEIFGEIVEKGKNVKDLEIGDKGIVYFYLSCGDCELCRKGRENICHTIKRMGFEMDGGFSEYSKLPSYNFCKIEDVQINDAQKAVLTDAVLTPYHALAGIGNLKAGNKILVVGLGGLGLHAVQIGKLFGAEVAGCDLRVESLNLARDYGLDLPINTNRTDPVAEIMDWTGGYGVDIVIEGVGIPETFEWSSRCIKSGGKLIFMGYDPLRPVSLNTMAMHYNEYEIIGTRLGKKQELIELIDFTRKGLIFPVVSNVIPINEINSGYEMLSKNSEKGRIVFDVIF